MSKIQGTNISAPVVPNDSNDIYPSHFAKYGNGGFRTVATIADRDAIPVERRENLMLVAVEADGITYELKSGTVDSDLSNNSNWVKKDFGGDLISVTYDELITLINNSELKITSYYRITDFKTIQLIQNSTLVHTGITEPIIVKPVSSNKLSRNVISELFLSDIIEYDVLSNMAEDGVTPRPGKIIFRKDTINNLSAYYDWRNVKFRRYKLSGQTWTSGTTYSRSMGANGKEVNSTPVVIGSDGRFYCSKVTTNLNNDPTINSGPYGSSLYSNDYWMLIHSPATFSYVMPYTGTQITAGRVTLTADTSQYQDYYTFNTSYGGGNPGLMNNISIGKSEEYNNIIFVTTSNGYYFYNITIGEGGYSSTFYATRFYNIKIGNDSFGNILTIPNNVFSLTAGKNFSFNFIGNYCYNLIIGDSFRNNILGGYVYDGTFGNFTDKNLFTGNFYSFSLGNNFYNNFFGYNGFTNKFGDFFRMNVVGNNYQDNIIAKPLQSCTLGNDFKGNTINGQVTLNNGTFPSTFGNNFLRNVINGDLDGMVFGDNFSFNVSNGPMLYSNLLATGMTKNVFISGVDRININSGITFANNVITLPLTLKTISTSLDGVNIQYKSPTGKVFYTTMNDEGLLVSNEII